LVEIFQYLQLKRFIIAHLSQCSHDRRIEALAARPRVAALITRFPFGPEHNIIRQ
jgi:hypothetical protein